MSLTSHLKSASSPIRQFFEEWFPDTTPFVREQNKKLKDAETIQLPGSNTAFTYMTLGRAIDYRLRYYFRVTPFEDLVAWRGALTLVDNVDDLLWEDTLEHDALAWGIRGETPGLVGLASGEDVELRYWHGRTQKHIGRWNSVFDSVLNPDNHPTSQRLSSELVKEFFASLDETLTRASPVARRLERNEEEQLARYCIVLSLFEGAYRSFVTDEYILFGDGHKSTLLQDLLSIAEAHWVDDLCSMSWLFYDRCRHLLSDQTILNPTFDGSYHLGGADADFILNNCLLDIKTTKKSKIEKIFLYQILGYVMIDFSDQYQLDAAGFYLPRQGLTLQWPLSQLLNDLSGGKAPPLKELRDRFQALCNQIARMP